MTASKNTVLSMHSIKNLLGNKGLRNKKVPLTETESGLLISLAKAFTQTNYKGNDTPVPSNINPFVKVLPKLRITRDELLKLMKVNRGNQNQADLVLKALKSLSSEILDFEYKRLIRDKNGLPILSHEGKLKMQTVTTQESLIKVSYIYNDDKTRLSHLEITPATIFIDQVDSYYLSIPDQLMSKFQELTGSKRVSMAVKYTFLYVCQQIEMRRQNPKRPKIIYIQWDELANIVKIPSASIKRKKGRVLKSLDSALDISKKLLLLTSWKFEGDHYLLELSNSNILKEIKNKENSEIDLLGHQVSHVQSKRSLEDIQNWKFDDGTKIAESTLSRWLKQRTLDEISLTIDIYESRTTTIKKDKHEAYLQALINKNSARKKINELKNKEIAEKFKFDNQWRELEIKKSYVTVPIFKDEKEDVNYSLNPEQFLETLQHLYSKWSNLNS